ncbi:hypothetical protein [Sphingomonas sp. SRS2]|uniref:hypothetical protein n=1 Tax=Sphingomonas sp. SRS2 TaxID=133190 RepID=UPI000618422A|nr:hypothetical protein [Sphingomonas sp. SRS2]KKC24851.1 hypothetical protein WP12_16570 [Sphingomonas sp. SRS2]
MDIVARLKMNGQNFSAELGRTLGDAERRFGSTGSVIGRNLSDGIGGGLQQAASRVPVLGGALTGLSGTALITAAGLGAVTLAMMNGIAEAETYERAVRGIDAVLKATGNNTGMARDELVGFANDMEGVWATPAEEIMKAEQVLASFDGVAGSTFKRAIESAADLSAVYGGDLTSNVEKVGTVLQNLAQGEVTGLSKGFKFLGVETLTTIGNLAEMGKTAEAQQALLDALAGSVGGNKKEDGEGLSGAFFRLGDAVGDATRGLATSTGTYDASRDAVDRLADSVGRLADGYTNAKSARDIFDATVEYLTPGTPAPKPREMRDTMRDLDSRPGFTSLGDMIAEGAAGRAYASAEAQRKKDRAAEAAKKAATKAQSDAEREAEKTASDLTSSLDSLRDKYGSVSTATWEYVEALREIDHLQSKGTIGPAEASRLKLNVQVAGMDPDGKLAAAVKAQLGTGDLTTRASEAQDIGEAQRAAIRETADYWKDVNKRAVEDVADIMTDLIGGKAGKLIGDLFSVAGGGRSTSPYLDMLTKGGSIWKNSGIAGKDGETAESVGKLDKTIGGIFGLSGEFTQSIGRMLAGAALGAQAGGLIGSSKASQFGGMAGGALGEKAGEMLGKSMGKSLGKLAGFAGPLGSIAGGLLGSALGSAFTKVKWGASTISFKDGALSAGDATGNSGSAKKAASASASSVVGSLESIIEQLGGNLLSAPDITIGQRHGDYRVNTGGTSLKIAKGAMEFDDDQQAAIEYAIKQMLSGAVIDGISQAAKNILKSDQDLEDAVMKAGLIEGVPKSLKARLDPLGAAIDALNDKWERTVDALREGGASAEQMAEAQKLYNLELDEVKNTTRAASADLKDFLQALGMGSASPLSLRDQEAMAEAALKPFLDKINAGSSIDQSAYQAAAQTYLDIERQLYGSTSNFFAAFDQIQAATTKAIAAIDNAVPIGGPASDPFAEKISTATQASVDLLSQISQQTATQQGTLDGILAALRANGGTGFLGGMRQFG